MTRTLLIDADLLAYRTTAANQRSYDWDGDGQKAIAADEEAARRQAEKEVEQLADKLKADEVLICLSDDFSSFRKDRIDPTYKAIRAAAERPVHLYDLKDHLATVYDHVRWTALEADDVMGIIATDPSRTDERIIVSADKDLMGIPGKLHRPAVRHHDGRLIRPAATIDITPLEAIRFHFWQAIVGDITDGYPGARGVGDKSIYAQDVLEAETEEEAWGIVLEAFSGRGGEDEALKQARLARILQFVDYDGRSPRLWLPPAYDEDAPVD